MSQKPKKSPPKTAIQRGGAASPSQAEFDEVLALIDAAKARAVAAVNTDPDRALLEHRSTHQPEDRRGRWGQRTVEALAEYHPAAIIRAMSGFSGKQPLADDAVLRDLPRPAKTRQRC